MSLLFQIFICSITGVTGNQVFYFIELENSTPTIGCALTNILPALTFILAVLFRQVSVGIKKTSGQAKLLGTVVYSTGNSISKDKELKEEIEETEEERSGLLEIKALINPNSIFGHLGDWTANKELDIANCFECASSKMTMKKMWVWMLLALFTLVGEWHGRCYGCLEEERIGLLEIKSSFDPYGFYLIDWVDTSNESISNCCEWGRIECDNTTRRVIQLNLWGVRGVSLGDLVLNASLFLPFKELQSLDLGDNAIVGCHENQDLLITGLKHEIQSSSFKGINAVRDSYGHYCQKLEVRNESQQWEIICMANLLGMRVILSQSSPIAVDIFDPAKDTARFELKKGRRGDLLLAWTVD
ncbi:hypothetical protein DKX38_006992 [Salix brachista]|uniref:Leucine-rich repeat-containing N-terminal plant-type domain-containing protein n=1 Tax=Salix brachista TaxID=2182728 RepID=A0A5N5MNW1_9ROSI|nr:hypothetical protein DKX38_006992 [Salix brachista]